MDETKSYLLYSPPKSKSLGHAVRDKNVRRVTEKMINGFVSCFNATTDNKLQLTLHYNKTTELEKANRTIDKINVLLGPAKRQWDNVGFEHMDNTITWESDNANILNVLDYVDTISDEHFLPLSKYWISFFYRYGTKDEPNGHIMCSIEDGRLFVRLRVIFPGTIDDNATYDLLSNFQTKIPIKLNSKIFRRLGPSKNGFGQWKLDGETQKRIDNCLLALKTK